MCGRFGFDMPRAQAMTAYALEAAADYPPRRNIAPGEPVAAIVADPAASGGVLRILALHHWGLVPFWAKDRSMASRCINARLETAAEKPAFRAAFAARRCLIPATCFYEWKKEPSGRKIPHAIVRRDGVPLAMAGLWEHWTDPATGEPFFSVAILTTEANALVAEVHDRMPAMPPPEVWDAWLDPATPRGDLPALLPPCPPEALALHPVGLGVNRPGNEWF